MDVSNVFYKMGMVLLASCLLTGCGAGTSGSGRTGTGNGDENSMGQGQAAGQNAGPKGRYREEAVPIPEEMRGPICDLFVGRDGGLEMVLYGVDEDGGFEEFRHFTYTPGSAEGWVADPAWWGTALAKEIGLDMTHICYGQDGRYYLCGIDEKMDIHLYQVGEDGAAVELLKEVLCPDEEGAVRISPDKLAVNSKGQILLSTFAKAYVFTQEGEELFQFDQDHPLSSSGRSILFDDVEYVTFYGGDIVRYSLADKTAVETIAYEDLLSDGDNLGCLAEDGEGGLYIADANGLAHINRGGALWERLIDGRLTTLRYPDLCLEGWFPGDQGDFYGLFSKLWQDDIQMFHYVYDPTMPSVPPVTLTVYSLERFSSVQQAAALFQQQNPDILVEYRTGTSDGGAGSGQELKEDMLRSLNTELLNGKGADVLLLDGLPRDSLKEKGVLLDMREVFGKIAEETPLLGAVLEDFTEADGSIYAMPSRIAFPVVFGEERAVEAFRSLDGIKAYGSREGIPLVAKATYGNLLRMLASLDYQEIFDGQDGLPKEETLEKYLETVKILGQQVGAVWEFSRQELEADPVGLSNTPVNRGDGGNVINFDRGYAASQVAVLDSVAGSALYWAALDKHPGMELTTAGGIYLPSAIVGINGASSQKEAAKAFVRTLFSTQVQQVEFYDRENEGFPVQKEALESWKGMVKNVTIGTGMADGYMLIAAWPDEEKRARLVELAESLTEPVEVDQTVMEMIVDGAKGYLEGKEDVETAAKAISGKLRLYRAEQS